MVLVFCTSSHNENKIMKISRTVFNLQGRHECMLEMAMFNVQRAINPNVGKPQLRLMCSARRLIMLYICVNIS